VAQQAVQVVVVMEHLVQLLPKMELQIVVVVVVEVAPLPTLI
jgi:hypothetical protein